MKKILLCALMFLAIDLVAQPVYELFKENGKTGVKNSTGSIVIQPVYEDILIYNYAASAEDTFLSGKIFVAVEKGEIKERVHLDSSGSYQYDDADAKTVRRVNYKTVNNGTLDIYNGEFNLVVDNAEDFAYLDILGRGKSVFSGFFYYRISDVYSFGGSNYFSFENIDNDFPSLYRKNGKWGMINKNEGNTVGNLYDSISRSFSGELFIYNKGKTGIANAAGTVLVEPLYDQLTYPGLYSIADFYIVKNGSKYGVVKKENKIIVPVDYNSIIPVNEKYLIVNKDGVIKRKEERIKMPAYEYDDYMNSVHDDYYFDFKDSLIIGGKFGLYDSNGKLIIPENYSYISVIGDVFRVVKGGKENTEIYSGSGGEFYYTYFPNEPGTTYEYGHYQHHENVYGGKRSYIDANGNKIFKGIDSVNLVVNEIDYLYEMPASHSPYYFLQKGNKYGIADSLRNIIVPVKYETVYPLTAKRGEKQFAFFVAGNNGLLGLYDNKGKELLPARFNIINLATNNENNPYAYAYNYYEYGINAVDTLLKEEKNIQSVFLTGEGGKKQTIKNSYYDEIGFPDYEYEILKYVKYSLYSLEGEKLTREFYDTLFTNYGSNLITARKFHKYGLLNMEGNNVIRCEYDQVIFQGSDRFVVYNGELCGLIAENGILIPVEYDAVSGLGNDLFRLTRGYLHGIYSLSKGTILPVEYDYLYKDYYQDYILLTQQEKFGMSDGNGNILLPCIYDGLELQAYGFVPRITKISEAGLIGFYDKDKKLVILEPSISHIEDAYGDRFMRIKKGGEPVYDEYGEQIDYTGGKMGIIDSTAKIIVPANYDQVSSYNNEAGLFRAMNVNQQPDYFDSLGNRVTNGDQIWAGTFISRLSKRKPAVEINVSSASGPFGCDATAFYIDKSGNYWLGTGSSGGVYRSEDKGKTWNAKNNGIGPVHAFMLTEMNDTLFLLSNQYNELNYDNYYIDEIIQMNYYDVITQQWMPYSSKEFNEMGELPFFYDLERIKQNKYLNDTLNIEQAGKRLESAATYLEEYYNNEGYYDPYNEYYAVNFEHILSHKENGTDTIRENMPPDVYSLYGGEIAYGNNEQVLLAKSGAYRIDANEKIERIGEEGMIATDISQTLSLNDGRIIAKEGSSDIWQFYNGKWTCVFDFYNHFSADNSIKRRNVKTGYVSADKNDKVYFCSGGELFQLDKHGKLKTLLKTDTLVNLLSGGTTEVNEYGNILEATYYRFKPLSAARNHKNELYVLGALQDYSFNYEMTNYYALALLDENTGKLNFKYGIFDQPAFEPFIKTDKKGGVYMFTQRTVFKAGDSTFKRVTNYLNEYSVLKFATTAVSPEGDIVITDYPDKLKYYEHQSKQWHTLKISDKRIALSTIGFDQQGNLLGATGFMYTFYCGGPGELVGEAGLYRAKFTDMGIEWEKIKNEINPKIISIEPNAQFGVLLGSSGSGLLFGK